MSDPQSGTQDEKPEPIVFPLGTNDYNLVLALNKLSGALMDGRLRPCDYSVFNRLDIATLENRSGVGRGQPIPPGSVFDGVVWTAQALRNGNRSGGQIDWLLSLSPSDLSKFLGESKATPNKPQLITPSTS